MTHASPRASHRTNHRANTTRALPALLRARAGIHRSGAAALLLAVGAWSSTCAAQATADAVRYREIAIAQPKDGATVFDNAGHVVVKVDIAPVSDLAAGDRVVLLLDGRQVAEARGEQVEIDSVDRGEHHLEARIVGRSGETLIGSPPVTFYLWQASRRFPSRR